MESEHKKTLSELLEVELKHLDETGQRHRIYSGMNSSRYDGYMRDAINLEASPRIKAWMIGRIIQDAFHCGYDTTQYLEQFKKFCEQHRLHG